MTQEYVSIREAADILQIGTMTTYKAVWEGKLKAEKRDNTYRISRESIEEYRAQRDEEARFDKRRAVRL